jgi:drug/metabolite transporter (DMT)-like permease
MPIIALTAALGASTCWAVGSLIAHRPATQLGAFEFTRTQLISSFALLIVIVTAFNGWQSVTWAHWPSFVAASLIGVVFTNLAMIACLRRGGPRRMQLLVSMSAPFAALLGFLFLGESMSPRKLIGVGLAFIGLLLAILFGRRGNTASRQSKARLQSSLHLGSSLRSVMPSDLLL